jgi:hypothetical protein
MTAMNGTRARRSDAGIVRPTERDVRVLRWLGEMYGAPLSIVGELYGVGERDTRRHVCRLVRAGFASRQLAPSRRDPTGRGYLPESWLVPTRRGLRYVGLDYEGWSLVGWKAVHVAAVARLRLQLQAEYPGAGWESERACRARWHGTGARVRIPDGVLEVEGQRVGIELELHRKSARRYPEILADLDPTLTSCWWFTRPADLAWLRALLAELACPTPQHVLALGVEQ